MRNTVTKQGVALAVVAAVVGVAAIAVLCTRLDSDGAGATRFSAEETRAIESAWTSLRHVDMGDKWLVEVERHSDVFIVTWPLPPGSASLNGDFRARVKVDARSYEVITIAIGS